MQHSPIVDIYDHVLDTWTTHTLAIARYDMAACSLGNTVIFAGGDIGGNIVSNAVEIYDSSTDSWSTTLLSQARARYVAVAVPAVINAFSFRVLPIFPTIK